ncbi:MAG: ArsC/Spx/MgsR family protein [Paracoccaceae bacterium]
MNLYGLKNCDTCRKAMKALPQATLVDVRSDGVPANVLRAALDKFGDAVVNTRSTTWRGLDDATRAGDPMQLLTSYPALMKRPLIEADGELHLGWTKATQDALT